MNRRKLLQRLTRHAVGNVSFHDLVNLAEGLGFRLARTSGSHHVFTHPQARELLNLQNVDGQAKPYQIRQFLRLVELYNMRLEEDSE
jgi:hypothetical protein